MTSLTVNRTNITCTTERGSEAFSMNATAGIDVYKCYFEC